MKEEPQVKKNKKRVDVSFSYNNISGVKHEELFSHVKLITRKLNTYTHPSDVLFRTHRYEFHFEQCSPNHSDFYITLNLRKLDRIPRKNEESDEIPHHLLTKDNHYLIEHSSPALDHQGEDPIIDTTFEKVVASENYQTYSKIDMRWAPSSRCKWHNISVPNLPYFFFITIYKINPHTLNYDRISLFRTNLFQIVCKPRVYFNRSKALKARQKNSKNKSFEQTVLNIQEETKFPNIKAPIKPHTMSINELPRELNLERMADLAFPNVMEYQHFFMQPDVNLFAPLIIKRELSIGHCYQQQQQQQQQQK